MAQANFETIKFRRTVKWLKSTFPKQYFFAAAVTLTRLAQSSQKKIQGRMGSDFDLRAERRLKRGVRIGQAKKRDKGNMQSVVKDIDKFMWLHVWGGTKTARSRYVATPGDDLQSRNHRTATGKVKKRWAPKTLFAKKHEGRRPRKKGRRKKPVPFVFTASHGRPVMAVRTGKERKPLEFLWGFKKDTKIDRSWPFDTYTYDVVKDRAGREFIRQYNRAIKSAK